LKNIHIASCVSRSERQSPAQCQRHQARGHYCYEYLPFKLILLTNIQANYWWGQMHCGPPNQNFGRTMAHPAHAARKWLGLESPFYTTTIGNGMGYQMVT